MKLSLRNFAPAVLTAALIFLPLVALGQPLDNSVPGGFDNSVPGAYPSSVTPTCNGAACSVQNPLAVSSFCDLLKIVLQALLILGLPIAVIFLVLAGFKYIIAYGNPGDITKAHENLKWTVIGVARFLGAWTIAQIIKATLVSLGVSGFGSC